MRSMRILYHGFSSGLKAERIIETTSRDQATPIKTKIFRNRRFLEKIQTKSDFDIPEFRSSYEQNGHTKLNFAFLNPAPVSGFPSDRPPVPFLQRIPRLQGKESRWGE